MPKWEVNLNAASQTGQLKSYEQLPEPFGFSTDVTESHVELPRKRDLIEKKLMEMATASKGQIFMTMFMFWMIGNGVSIYTIFFIFQSLFSSVTAMLKVNKMFQPYEGQVSSLFKYKAIYIGIAMVQLGLVAYKLSNMGLLPVAAPDYIDLVPIYHSKHVIAQG